MQGKFIIVLDSLGNLAADKEVDDAEADKTAFDMGLRAKDRKSSSCDYNPCSYRQSARHIH